MARNDGHCASVPVGQRLFRLSTRIPVILLRPIKASGISNIRVGVVYKVIHEVCTQVVGFSLPGSGCMLKRLQVCIKLN
jgi:hypothetical protein